ncbi:hypothetical protein B0H15DRAFT_861325 [Mycena belliarum]|uniref:C3H1-type domain-containing protein n=1 Tax=Mycena belliarum TaxID=1033014 RepID=A0AAD6TU98_9AGAR|nr:hypothetical protein B0H15DRAFT_861325 [Mycena belliae]
MRSNVVVLSLLNERNLYDLYAQLLDSIRSVATVHFVESKAAFGSALKITKPSAVLAIDGAITKEVNADVLQQLIQFTKGGGIVVCCCNFSNGLNYRAGSEYFSRWGLPWDAGSYFRTTVHLHALKSVPGLSFEGLSPSYSLKSLSLVHVRPEHAVYNPSSSSLVESHVFEADKLPVDPAESPCTYAAVGQGYLGYIGDVNGEEDSTRTILAMIHLSPAALLPSTSERLTGLKPLPNGEYEPTTQSSDPDSLVMFSDAIRKAGDDFMYVDCRMGRAGESLPRPVSGTRPPPGPAFASARPPRRSRESEVEKRAVKRAENSTTKKEKAEALKELGNARFRQGDNLGAVSFYKQAVAVRGPQPTYLANLAAAYLKLDMYREAEEACEEALKQDPRHLKARFRRGTARLNMLCFKDAMKDFKACAKLVSNDPQVAAAIIDTRQEFAKLKADGYEDQWADSGGQDLSCEDSEEEDGDMGEFEFFEPGFDEKPVEIFSDSDSSDFEHVGNGVPCRFYNHDGCAKGNQCRFKHAPHPHTTRDELGRNVCNFWLLDGCRFGDRCVFTHSKEYLPETGWWASDDLSMMKDIMNDVNRMRGFI